MLVLLFLIKVLAAFLYAYIHFDNGWRDTFVLFTSGKNIAHLFFDYPDLYFKFIFDNVEKPFPPEITQFITQQQVLGYGVPRSDFLIRFNALLMPFSYGFYSVQCILYELFSFAGIFFIYDFLSRKISFNNRLLRFFLFFAPSILFWLSGLHKDGLTIFGLATVLYSVDQLLQKKWAYIALLFFGLWFTFYIRDYALFLFIPALLSYIISRVSKMKFYIPYLGVYFIGLSFFFLGKFISPKFNFPQRFVRYQKGFMLEEGDSSFDMVALEPTIESFASSVPVALFNSFLKPSIPKADNLYSILAATENLLYVLLAFLLLIFSNIKRLSNHQKSLLFSFMLFGISYFLMLGLIVDNLGAIVRYKTTPLVFLGSALILLFDVNRFERFFKINNKKISKYVHQ